MNYFRALGHRAALIVWYLPCVTRVGREKPRAWGQWQRWCGVKGVLARCFLSLGIDEPGRSSPCRVSKAPRCQYRNRETRKHGDHTELPSCTHCWVSPEKGWEVREETMLPRHLSHESGDSVLVQFHFSLHLRDHHGPSVALCTPPPATHLSQCINKKMGPSSHGADILSCYFPPFQLGGISYSVSGGECTASPCPPFPSWWGEMTHV